MDHEPVTTAAADAADLEGIARWYDDPQGLMQGWRSVHAHLVRYRCETIIDLIRGQDVVELGMADGAMTAGLLAVCRTVVGVEGAAHFVAACSQRFASAIAAQRLAIVHALFAQLDGSVQRPVVLASLILEHLADPVASLRAFARCAVPGGLVVVAVPNALSLHRQVAVKMGLLERVDALNAQDLKLGHQRVYTPALLRAHISAAGLRLVEMRGTLLKPLSNQQMEQTWSTALLDGFFALGREMPELCAEIVAVCRAGGPPP